MSVYIQYMSQTATSRSIYNVFFESIDESVEVDAEYDQLLTVVLYFPSTSNCINLASDLLLYESVPVVRPHALLFSSDLSLSPLPFLLLALFRFPHFPTPLDFPMVHVTPAPCCSRRWRATVSSL